MPQLIGDEIDIDDECILVALDRMAGADLLARPSEFLHGPQDFQQWLDDFRRCVAEDADLDLSHDMWLGGMRLP